VHSKIKETKLKIYYILTFKDVIKSSTKRNSITMRERVVLQILASQI